MGGPEPSFLTQREKWRWLGLGGGEERGDQGGGGGGTEEQEFKEGKIR